jgi:large subunit ribosomal protein L21
MSERMEKTKEAGVYAVVADGGKQYRVAVGDLVKLERRSVEIGEKVSLGPVLAIQEGENMILDAGQLSPAKVLAEVVKQGRNRKIKIFKKKRRKAYDRMRGHRQSFTEVKVLEIQR